MSAAAAFEHDADTAVGVWAIVVAAGTGSRFGGAKQYALLGGRRVVDWSLATARSVCGAVVLVVPPDRAELPEAADLVVPGGATRSESVRAGLAVLDPTRATTRRRRARRRATVRLAASCFTR